MTQTTQSENHSKAKSKRKLRKIRIEKAKILKTIRVKVLI